MWKDLQQNRKEQWFVGPICEFAGGVSLPPKAMAARAVTAVSILKKAIDSGDFKAIQRALQAMESPVNDFVKAVDDYYRGIVDGASSSITVLKVTKGAGFVALGVLATTFTGGAAAAAIGIEGTMLGSSVAAGVGGAIGGTVDSVATGLGRGMAGADMKWGELAAKPVTGLLAGAVLQGPLSKAAGKLVPQRLADKVFTSGLAKTKEIAPVVQRLGVAGARKAAGAAIMKWWNSSPKAEITRVEKAVYQRLGTKASQEQIAEVLADELAKSGALEKALKGLDEK
jgi:hypothetical protein